MSIVVTKHQNTADQADEQQRANLKSGADRLVVFQLFAVGERDGETPSKGDDVQAHNDCSNDHQDFGCHLQAGNRLSCLGYNSGSRLG